MVPTSSAETNTPAKIYNSARRCCKADVYVQDVAVPEGVREGLTRETHGLELDLEDWVGSNSLGMGAGAQRILSIRCGVLRGRTAQVMFWEEQVDMTG